MVSTIDEARTPAELAEWLRVWADGYEEGVDFLDDNDARQIADAVERVCAPCNAAALREALEKISHEYRWGLISCRTCVSSEADVERVSDLFEKQIDAALAAPPRNCDRFATAEEAVVAFADHLRAWENAHGVCSERPDHPVQVPAGAFAWLFATAEGGAK